MVKINCIEPVARACRILSEEGLLPNDKRKEETLYKIIKLVVHIIFSITTAYSLVTNGVTAIKNGNNMALIHTTCIFIPLMNLSIKIMIISQKNEYFGLIIHYLKSDIFNNHSQKLNYYVEFVYKCSELIWKYYTSATIVYLFICAVLPMVIDIKMAIPFPLELGKYTILYKLFHIVMCTYWAINSMCLDVLYMSFLGMCIAQLYILEKRLMYVFEEANEMCTNTSYEKSYFYEEKILMSCVLLHEALSQYVDKLNVILSYPLFIQYFFGCFIICNLILQLTIFGERNTTNIVYLIVYAGLVFSQLAVYHWLGNEILFKSGGIANACYTSNWYKLSSQSKRTLIILMERAKRPLTVQLFKLVSVSLESLGTVLQWSYSLFALIKARYNSNSH